MKNYRIILVKDTPCEADQVEQYNCSLEDIRYVEKYLSQQFNIKRIKENRKGNSRPILIIAK
jgi:hypothetical protein